MRRVEGRARQRLRVIQGAHSAWEPRRRPQQRRRCLGSFSRHSLHRPFSTQTLRLHRLFTCKDPFVGSFRALPATCCLLLPAFRLLHLVLRRRRVQAPKISSDTEHSQARRPACFGAPVWRIPTLSQKEEVREPGTPFCRFAPDGVTSSRSGRFRKALA
eukprot:scaffold1661_cov251-Pinguiococcus_pyrenoidosus.AAC.42